MTFFRHFIDRGDFEIMVITPSSHVDDQALPYVPVRTALPKWWARVCRTRFLPWLYPVQLLGGGRFLTADAVHRASAFHPDAVFTVAGNWDWTALAAQRLARSLCVPLIASFNDWFDYGAFPVAGKLQSLVERRFRQFYREADLALCTSEGMREALGEHPNDHVWYPTGAPMKEAQESDQPRITSDQQPLLVFFGGSLGDWYGPMMESIVVECEKEAAPVQFKIFGALESWSAGFDEHARRKGIFRGRVSFDALSSEAAAADLLILPMGFGEDCAQVERTSFKTKFLDYLSFRRPILVWGPEYCTAVQVAREFDSAECVTDQSPAACCAAITRLAADPDRRRELMDNAFRMYEDRFHPDRIHQDLVRKIEEVVAQHPMKDMR